MDDTILLSTTREMCIRKATILAEFCNRSGMVINQGKTMFMVINGSDADKVAMTIGDLKIQNCDSYVYLGATFTQDGKVATAVDEQCRSKQCHLWKCLAFH